MSQKTLSQRFKFDPYLLALIATVAFASLVPARGVAAPIVGYVTDFAIAGLFFLHGARLAPQTIVAGMLDAIFLV
jgi:solute carrier family 10 (sodium/bile acid cotransporter), member 7